MNIDYILLAAKAMEDRGEKELSCNLPTFSQSFRVAAKKYRQAAELDPSKKDEYNALATQCEAKSGQKVGDSRPQKVGEGNIHPTPAYQSDPIVSEDMSAFYTFYSSKDLNDGFESVIGLEEAKSVITEYVINPMKYPESYNYSFTSSKCILLEGPPGTGKTTFARAVAKELDQPFALVNVASLVNCYVGETGKIIDKVFDSLRKYVKENHCGLTVFFDEFDEIAKSRGGDDKASQTAVPALLRNLDGMKENKNFLVIANTNCFDQLDAGILSRFCRKIFIPLPDKTMRKHFFESKLKQLEPEYYSQLDIDLLTEASNGMSGRAITQACDDFLYHIGGIKAGLRTSTDINADMIAIIHNHNK